MLEGLDPVGTPCDEDEARRQGDPEVVEVIPLDPPGGAEERGLLDDIDAFEADLRLGEDLAAEDGSYHLHPGADPEDRAFRVPDPGEEIDSFGVRIVLQGCAAEDDPVCPLDGFFGELEEVDDLAIGPRAAQDPGDRIDELAPREGPGPEA